MIEMESSDSNKLLIHFFFFLFLQILLHQSHAQKGLSTRLQQHIGIQGLASERHGTRRWVSCGYELANPFELLPFQSSAPSKKYYRGITWKKQQWNSPIFLHNTIEYISNFWAFESYTPRKALVGLSIFPLIMATLPWQSTFLMTAPIRTIYFHRYVHGAVKI